MNGSDTSLEFIHHTVRAACAGDQSFPLAADARQGILLAELDNPTVSYAVSDGQIVLEDQKTMSLQGCPSDAVGAVELQRTIHYAKGQTIYDAHPVIGSFFVLLDKSGNIVGSFQQLQERVSGVVSFQEGLTLSGMHLSRPVSEEEVAQYIGWQTDPEIRTNVFESYFHMRNMMHQVPLEIGVQLMRAYEWVGHGNIPPENENILRELIDGSGEEFANTYALGLLNFVDTPEQLNAVLGAFGSDKSTDQMAIFTAFTHMVLMDIERIDDYAQKNIRLAPYLYHMAEKFFWGVVRESGEKGFSWDSVRISMNAFHGLLSDFYVLPRKDQAADPVTFRETLMNYAAQYPDNPDVADIIQPLAESLWLSALQVYKPDAWQKTATFFYDVMQKEHHLERIANSSTGDTEEEISRFSKLIVWLTSVLPNGYKHLDAGSGTGERVLRPVLNILTEHGLQPASTLAVDKDPQNMAPDAPWEFVRADFGKKMIQSVLGYEKYDLITQIWSMINDLPPVEQGIALNNFSSLLNMGGHAVIDIPVNYEREKLEHHRAHPDQPFGVITKSFTAPDGSLIEKEFMITEWYELLVRIRQAGFRIVNMSEDAYKESGIIPIWLTQGGNLRATLVLEKVAEPVEAIDVMLVGSGTPV